MLDLYSGVHDKELDRYARQFYSFMVVSEEVFDRISGIVEEREEEKISKMAEREEGYTEVN